MGGVVNVQNPSGCFSMSTLGPLQKLSLTLLASGALNRICTRELASTRGYCASRTFDVAALKSSGSCAKQKVAASSSTIPIRFIMYLREKHIAEPPPWSGLSPLSSEHRHGNP